MLSRLDTTFKIFGAILLLIVGSLAALPYMSSVKANNTMEVLKSVAAKERAFNAVLSHLKDAETGQRGFLIGSDETSLNPITMRWQSCRRR